MVLTIMIETFEILWSLKDHLLFTLVLVTSLLRTFLISHLDKITSHYPELVQTYCRELD